MKTEVHRLELRCQTITFVVNLHDDHIVFDWLPINMNKATAPFPEDVDFIRQWIDGFTIITAMTRAPSSMSEG